MKKILMILMMVFTMMFAFVSCATTSSIDANGIVERKLTNVSYIKKNFSINAISDSPNSVLYILDNGKGLYSKTTDGYGYITVCVYEKDGELYGSQCFSDRGAVCSFNLHDNRCHDYTESAYVNGYRYSYTHDESKAEFYRNEMFKLAKNSGVLNGGVFSK